MGVLDIRPSWQRSTWIGVTHNEPEFGEWDGMFGCTLYLPGTKNTSLSWMDGAANVGLTSAAAAHHSLTGSFWRQLLDELTSLTGWKLASGS